ncbi:uncharacterized protein LOC100201983 [Hydra vulgaris]|uniref:uncharacterized protein LOC100201983 n=1 Tax=Hydra vulgaris TaxID=6087 RepID=UPI0001925750|nr:uncharacterized protein LOC100201983 [Hydra vulgaris]XP_012558283.1 uncharacterized protein LOC100201983 [Hydra vulgaris]
MKPLLRNVLLAFNCILLVICSPYNINRRRKREQSDAELMRLYWSEQLPLGFFVNDGSSETGESLGVLSARDHIQETHEGSGVGRRDDIQRKPTSSVSLKANIEGKKSLSNQKMEKLEENNKMEALVEKSEAKTVVAETETDLGDKRKVRRSVTCQGQKEWLQCDGPYELIKIKSAFWGRDDDHTCKKNSITHGLSTDKNCAQDESNTMQKVREACDNENVCEVVASGVYFDKADCNDVYKFLRLEWQCAPSESRIKESIA